MCPGAHMCARNALMVVVMLVCACAVVRVCYVCACIMYLHVCKYVCACVICVLSHTRRACVCMRRLRERARLLRMCVAREPLREHGHHLTNAQTRTCMLAVLACPFHVWLHVLDCMDVSLICPRACRLAYARVCACARVRVCACSCRLRRRARIRRMF